LIEAVQGGFERTVFGLGNMENEMEDRVDRTSGLPG
jgi:hypothetical protein